MDYAAIGRQEQRMLSNKQTWRQKQLHLHELLLQSRRRQAVQSNSQMLPEEQPSLQSYVALAHLPLDPAIRFKQRWVDSIQIHLFGCLCQVTEVGGSQQGAAELWKCSICKNVNYATRKVCNRPGCTALAPGYLHPYPAARPPSGAPGAPIPRHQVLFAIPRFCCKRQQSQLQQA